MSTHKIPFSKKGGKIESPLRAILDRCIIYPTPSPERMSGCKLIEIPENLRANFHDGTGILLSVGPGYTSDDGKFHPTSDQLKPGVKVLYDKTVPWGEWVTGPDGERYRLVICGAQDIQGVFT